MKPRVAGVLLVLCLFAAAAPAHAAVTAALSDTRITPGATVELTLTYDGLTASDPHLAPLRKEFDILGTSSSTSVQIGTGGSAESTQEVLTLAPKGTGRLTIPPIRWDGEHSAPLTLTVTGAAPGAGGASGPRGTPPATVFIVSRVFPARPYVQAQVRLSVHIYTAEPLYHASLDFSGNGSVLVKHVGIDQYSNVVRNGQSYQVITRHFVLFPLRRGRISLPGPVLSGDVAVQQNTSPWGGNPFSGFFGGLMRTLRPIEVRGEPIVLMARRRPPGAAGRHWLPARKVTLTAHWNPRTLRAHAGDPLTVTLELQARGLTAAQLPDLASRLTPPRGLSAYPDRAKLANRTRNAGIVGSRDQTIAFIASGPGHYVLPPIRVRWWDTHTGLLRLATLPAQTLDILPALGAPAVSPPVQAPSPTPALSPPPHAATPPAPASPAATSHRRRVWQWLTVALAALWLVTVGGWLWSRRQRRPRPAPPATPTAKDPPRPDATSERSAFRAACARNDAAAARHHLLGWMSAAWSLPPTSLSPLAAASRDPHLDAQLRELERACFGEGNWQGEPLAQCLRELPARPGIAGPGEDALPPLYP